MHLLRIFLSITFVFLGFFLIGENIIISVVCIGFFGFATIILIMQLFDKSPILILNYEGLMDKSVGLILWSDIVEIKSVDFVQFTLSQRPVRFL